MWPADLMLIEVMVSLAPMEVKALRVLRVRMASMVWLAPMVPMGLKVLRVRMAPMVSIRSMVWIASGVHLLHSKSAQPAPGEGLLFEPSLA